MSQPRWLQALSALGLEFWLPLPLLGVMFWVGSGWVTDRVLSYNYQTTERLRADTEQEVKIAMNVTVISIEAEIHRRENFTEVQVNVADSALKELRFEFPITEVGLVETAIIQELGISADAVKKLVRYRIDN